MVSGEMEARWRALAEEAVAGMKEWRQQHPKATLVQIERALDERLMKVRARMLEDAAQVSAAADIAGAKKGERPVCVSDRPNTTLASPQAGVREAKAANAKRTWSGGRSRQSNATASRRNFEAPK